MDLNHLNVKMVLILSIIIPVYNFDKGFTRDDEYYPELN